LTLVERAAVDLAPGPQRTDGVELFAVIASEAKQSIFPQKEEWIASSLRSSQ